MRLRAPLISLFLCIASIVLVVACRPLDDDPASRMRDVERRILAPCCRRQTLEDHESEVARVLRTEIQSRIERGEQSATIEDDLVRRYGEGIRAMPRGRNLRPMIGVAIAVVLGLGGLVVLRIILHRRASSAMAPDVPVDEPLDLDYHDRLDDELLELD